MAGILLVNTRVLPISSSVAEVFNAGTILLAIPLLLYSTDFIKWVKVAKITIVSFFLCIISVLFMASLAAFVFEGKTLESSAKISGMFVGVYTGGTPNMNAIGIALGVDDNTFPIINGADVVLGGIYFLFLISLAKRFLSLFLPPFDRSHWEGKKKKKNGQSFGAAPDKEAGFQKKDILPSLFAIGLTILICAASLGVAAIIKSILGRDELSSSIIILGITTLAIGASFWKKVRKIEGAGHIGNYLLLMFCVSIGTLADVEEIAHTGLVVFSYCAFVMGGSILLHYILAALLRIDTDTVIITSTAAIFGPPFVGPIAGALKNKHVLVSGLTTGLVGLALGNYLGIGLGMLLSKWIN